MKSLDVDGTVSENTDHAEEHPEEPVSETQPSQRQAEEEVRTEAATGGSGRINTMSGNDGSF